MSNTEAMRAEFEAWASANGYDTNAQFHNQYLATEHAWQGWQAASAGKAELLEALNGLLRHVDRETCQHDETYRGGAIWTICRQCGMKWADDLGGFKPHKDSPEVAAARAAISRATGEQDTGRESND